MRKITCTDNEIVLFSPKLTCFAKRAVAFLATASRRVLVYARPLGFGMNCAFPKRRIVCPVQQTFSHTAVKNLSEIRPFAIAYYDEVVIPLKKPAQLFPESV